MLKRHIEMIPTLFAANLGQGVQEVKERLPNERIVKLNVHDDVYWIKQAEQHLSLKSRLKKGDGRKSLLREGRNLHELAEKGIPVPEVIDVGEDYLVLANSGMTLNDLFLTEDYCSDSNISAYFAAGRALARLHEKGFALARGHPRDYCWDSRTIRFIDLETTPDEFNPKANGRRNLYAFVFFTLRIAFKVQRNSYREATAFLHGYSSVQAVNGAKALEAARNWAWRRWFWAACNFSVGLLASPNRFAKAKATALTIMVLRHFLPDPRK